MGYTAARTLALISIGVLSVVAVAQCHLIDRDSPAAVKQEVNRLYNKALDAMQSTLPSGVKVTTWMPSDDSRGQIKCLGAVAVPAIAELVRNNQRPFGQLVAIKMLGWIGGPEIVPPLARILSSSGDFVTSKTYALESLAAAPPDKALPVIQEILRNEKNPQLLEEAASVAARLNGPVGNR